MCQRSFKFIFWFVYTVILIIAFIPLKLAFERINIGPDAFKIRLDHLLHLATNLLICLYYLAGRLKGLNLFKTCPIARFIGLMMLLAMVTEVVQLWVPSRAFNTMDIVANVSGILAGIVVIRIFDERRLKYQDHRSKI